MANELKGLDYLDAKIGKSGVIPLDQAGFKSVNRGNADIFELTRQKQNYNTYIGDLISPYDNLQGVEIDRGMSQDQINDAIYQAQTGWEMVANALVGMAAIAGTTYVSNTVGVGNMVLEGTWDNTVNNYMAQLEDEARKRNEIYRPSDYNDWSLAQRLGNGVFWADLIQNLGFTIGSGLATATWMAIPGVGGALAKAPKIVQVAAGAFTGALGESSIEAVHHKNQEIQKNQQLAHSTFSKYLKQASTQEEIDALMREYSMTLTNIENDAVHGGNFVFGSNLAFLTLSNAIQFGDFYSRGFSTGRRVSNSLRKNIGKAVEETAEAGVTQLGKRSLGQTLLYGGSKTLINGITEANEEATQYVASKAASINADYNSFNGSKFNPQKREEVSGIWNSLMAAYGEAMHDNQFATEAAMGFFTGLIGMPTLKKSAMPIRIEGGLIGEMRNAFEERESFNKAIDNINNRLSNNKELNDYYEGLVRHLHYQDKENIAIEESNHREFANANSAKFISDIIMFDRVRRLDMLEGIIDAASTINEEQYKSLLETSTQENGEGAFMRNGNPVSYDEAQGILKDKASILKDKIKEYRKLKDKIVQKYPTLNEDSVDEALYHYMQSQDSERRGKQMQKELFDIVKDIASKEKNIPPEKQSLSQNISEDLVGITPDNIRSKLADSENSLLDKIEAAIKTPEYGITSDMVNELNTLTKDLALISVDYVSHVDSFNSIITKPQEANQKNDDRRKELEKQDKKNERKSQNEEKEKIVKETSTGNLANQLFEGIIDANELSEALHELHNDPELAELKKLQEASQMAKSSRNIVGTATTPGIIDNVVGTEEAKKDAKSFVMYATKNADSTTTILDESTYTDMDDTQIAEALGIDLSTFTGEDLDAALEEMQERKAQALAVLSGSLEKGLQDMEESAGMSVDIRTPDEIEQIGKDPVTPVKSNSNKTIIDNPVPTIKPKAVEETGSNNTQETTTWTSGLSYKYFGKTDDYGKEHLLVLKKHIEELTKKENTGAISEEEKSLLNKYKEDFATLRFMINQNVFSIARQKLVQPGTKLNFLIPAEFPNAVFLSVTGTDGLQYIVGNMIKSNVVADVFARKTQKQETGDYVEYNVTTVKEKKIGSLEIFSQQVHLQDFNKDFTLGIDLSTQGSSIADVRTLPNSEVGNKTEEEERIRQPIKSNGGNAYVLVETSNPEIKYITANIVSDTYVKEQVTAEETENTTMTPASYLQQVASSQASLQEKLAEIQEILDVDIHTIYETEDIETREKTLTCKVTSKGTWEKKNTRTVYGELTATPENLPQEILNLVSGRARYTVSRKYMNSTIGNIDYNQMMSSVLTTNLGSLETIGDWFTMEPVSTKNKLSQIEQVKRTPTVVMATSESKTTIENQGINYFVDTTSWGVYENKNGTRTLIKPTNYNDDVYKVLADTFLSKQGKALGLHTTPWGVYNSKERKFLHGFSALNLFVLSPILEGLMAPNASAKIQALVTYYHKIDSTVKTAELDAYIDTVENDLYKNKYSYDTVEQLQNQWDNNQKENIEVTKVINDPSLELGVEIIDDVTQTSIYKGQSSEDMHPVLLQKAKVILRKNTVQTETQQETTTTLLNVEDNSILQKIDKLGFLYVFNDLSSTRQKKLIEFFSTKNFRIVDRVIRNEMTRLSTMDVFEKAAYVDFLGKDEAPFRKTDTQHTKVLDLKRELSWLHKVLPQTKSEDRVRILKGLIKIANSTNNETAWGMLKNGIIHIVENSAEGTVYHEAFHFVTHTLMTEKELTTLYDEAKKQYKTDNISELEELLAEDFRRYITYDITENKGILKTLWNHIKQWIKDIFGKMTYIEKTYRNINKGLYAHRVLKESLETKYRKITENPHLRNKKQEFLDKIKNANTVYKQASEDARYILEHKGYLDKSFAYDRALEHRDNIPYGKEVIYIKEDKGNYRLLLYADLATVEEVKFEEETRKYIEEYLKENPIESKKISSKMSYQEYVSELAYLEEEIAKLTEEEKEYLENGYDYQYFKEREQQIEKQFAFDNLSEEEKEAIREYTLTKQQYEALSNAEKEVLLHCIGV